VIEPAQLALFTVAAAALVAAPGPDMLLVLGRALAQGRFAAFLSALGCGLGILVTSALVAFGLAALLQTSVIAFTAMKLTGAAYLVYLGVRTLRDQSLFAPQAPRPASALQIFVIATVGNIVNPKVALFMFAFLPQFVNHRAPDVVEQTLLLGAIFAGLTVAGFTLLGIAAASLTQLLARRPRIVRGLNLGAGSIFILSGLKIATFEQPH